MITMRQSSSPGSPDVEFDAYVPLTATWSIANALLDPPRLTALQDENGYLELKFHPDTGILVEVVLASAPGIHVEQGRLDPRIQASADLMPHLDSSDNFPAPGDRLVIRAYQDYLYISFGRDLGQWAGTDPLIFGVDGEQRLTAIAVRWTGTDRKSVLGH